MPEQLRPRLVCLFALIFVTLAVYWPAAHFSFINYDDPEYITLNEPVQHGVNGPLLDWAFHTSHAGNWHPLTWISHAVDCSLYGLNPGGHHLTSLFFHAANAALLFFVLLEYSGSLWRSALVAALFAWHPLHVESVAWVSERKDVLSTFFWLLTMAAHGEYAAALKANNPKAKLFYLLALGCFALGLLSKPMTVTLPFVLLLLDFWPLGRAEKITDGELPPPSPWVPLFVEKIPFFALVAADCIATFTAQKQINSVVGETALSFPARIANALVSYVLYLWKTIWPVNLALPYPYSHAWTFWEAAGAAVVLGAITVLVVRSARKQPWLLVGWFWFVGTLVPVIGLVQVGIQHMADRYTYLPLIGIFIMVAWSIPSAWVNWPRPGFVYGAVVAGALLFLLAGTEMQLQYWRNSVTLFSHTTQVTRDNILAEYNLATALQSGGDDDEAAAHYLKALAITPNPVEAQYNSQPQAHFNLGIIYRIHKKWPEAEAQFRAFCQAEPKVVRGHSSLGVALVAQGRDQEGMVEFRSANLGDFSRASEAQVLAMLDSAYGEAGNFKEAIATAERTREAALKAGDQNLAAAADKRIELYRAGKFVR